jgi:hypothetical protein
MAFLPILMKLALAGNKQVPFSLEAFIKELMERCKKL